MNRELTPEEKFVARLKPGSQLYSHLVHSLFVRLENQRLVNAIILPGGQRRLLISFKMAEKLLKMNEDDLSLIPGIGKANAKLIREARK